MPQAHKINKVNQKRYMEGLCDKYCHNNYKRFDAILSEIGAQRIPAKDKKSFSDSIIDIIGLNISQNKGPYLRLVGVRE